MAQINPVVYFAHGKESGPWGAKITALAAVAEALGFTVHSPSYEGMNDPQQRIDKLLALQPAGAPLVMVGSSMGGYVSAFAAQHAQPTALYLLAPALYMQGYEGEPVINCSQVKVIHGWHDDIVPVANAIRFAQRHAAELRVLNAGHTLNETIPALEKDFADFLTQALASSS